MLTGKVLKQLKKKTYWLNATRTGGLMESDIPEEMGYGKPVLVINWDDLISVLSDFGEEERRGI